MRKLSLAMYTGSFTYKAPPQSQRQQPLHSSGQRHLGLHNAILIILRNLTLSASSGAAMSRIKGSSGLLFMMITPSAPPACAAKALSEKAHPPPRSTATIAPIARGPKPSVAPAKMALANRVHEVCKPPCSAAT